MEAKKKIEIKKSRIFEQFDSIYILCLAQYDHIKSDISIDCKLINKITKIHEQFKITQEFLRKLDNLSKSIREVKENKFLVVKCEQSIKNLKVEIHDNKDLFNAINSISEKNLEN